MENAFYTALATCSGVAILLILLNIPLYLGKIQRNGWYGFRTPRTLSSDEIWYPVNREAALNFIIASVIILLTALILFFLGTNLPVLTVVIIITSVTVLAFIGALIKSFIFLSKLK